VYFSSAESGACESGYYLMADLSHPRLVAAIVAAIIAVVVVWTAVIITRWRRITWRDQMDAKIGALSKEARDSSTWAVWKVLTSHGDVAQPSLVLLRIRNSGLGRIGLMDVKRPLEFTFPGRVVKEFTVTDCRGVSRREIQPPGEMLTHVENSIALPPFGLRRNAGFKLLVLLSGAGEGIVVDGGLRRGSVLHESRIRGPLVQNIVFGSILLLLVGTQAGMTFSQAAALPSYCATGRLNLSGSTAFAPTAQQIASAYTAACPGATISVSPIATFNGLNAVAAQDGTGQSRTAQAKTADPPAGQMAMSDGQAPGGYPALKGNPVAVILFAVVVNKGTNVYNLTKAELRDIWLGTITNWKRLGGPDLPIRIVARTTASGTRRAFDQDVLGGQAEPAFSSYNCVTKNAVPSAGVTRCEVTDTGTLLQRVNSIPGAIGYAQISDAATYPNVSVIKINGSDPTISAVKLGAYPYWTVEYLYTLGSPAAGSLAAGFLNYVRSVTASDILRTADYTPCVDRGQSLMKTLCHS
jgi:ABC-type phosphate transport system substrate-binding protein